MLDVEENKNCPLRVNPFPEDHELLSIFESEPTILDADCPWFYNTLTFTGERSGIEYLVRISPAYGELEVRLGKLNHPITHLSFAGVSGLRLKSKRNDNSNH